MLVALAAAAALSACKADHARYVLRDTPEITARFVPVDTGRDWPSHLALGVHFARTGDTDWFLPWPGGTDDQQNLASTTDVRASGWTPPSPDGGPRPLGDLMYLAFDAGYRVIDDIPVRGRSAPAHFILPELGDRAWHADVDRRDSAPKQMFDLDGRRSRLACKDLRPSSPGPKERDDPA